MIDGETLAVSTIPTSEPVPLKIQFDAIANRIIVGNLTEGSVSIYAAPPGDDDVDLLGAIITN